jgi:hypothetical protein
MENKEKLEEVASNLAIKSVKEYMKIFPSCDNTFDYRRGFEEGFIEGVKYQAERMYSEENVLKLIRKAFEAARLKNKTMAKYRILEQNGRFYAQAKEWYGWDTIMHCSSLESAKKIIEKKMNF